MTEDARPPSALPSGDANEALVKETAEKARNLLVDHWEKAGDAIIERLERMEATLVAEFQQWTARMETVIARRITADEFEYMGKLEYIDGRLMTRSGVELFVGVKEFPESIRALEREREERKGKSVSQYLAEKAKREGI